MDFIFNRLTDIGLRRLYKFVLKRTIGKYLEDELLIDQLQVISRDGIVKLSDIRFNAAVLNEEFFDSLPVKIISLTVTELEVHMSYKTLLTDSCRFVVDNVNIVIAPNEHYVKTKSNATATLSDQNEDATSAPSAAHTAADGGGHTTEEGQRGLSFIANWIEVVVARLQVHVGVINVLFKIPQQSTEFGQHKHSEHHHKRATKHPSGGGLGVKVSGSKRAVVTHDIQLCFRNLQYFNDDPRSYENSSSGGDRAVERSYIAVSTRLTTGSVYASQATAIQLGAKKVCT